MNDFTCTSVRFVNRMPCLSPQIQVAALKSWHPAAEQAVERVVALAGKPVSEIDLVDFSDELTNEKKIAAQIETDVKDAKRRINAAKGPRAKRKAQKPATNNSEDDGDADADESEQMKLVIV